MRIKKKKISFSFRKCEKNTFGVVSLSIELVVFRIDLHLPVVRVVVQSTNPIEQVHENEKTFIKKNKILLD